MIKVVAREIASRAGRSLHARAQKALENSPIYELRELRVEHDNGTLAISGTVSSFYHKQLAQELVRSLCKNDDEIEFVNLIRVC